jgi:oleate hydratase
MPSRASSQAPAAKEKNQVAVEARRPRRAAATRPPKTLNADAALVEERPLSSGCKGRLIVVSNAERKAHLVGSGIANLAAAAYLIKDGGFLGANISIYEEESSPGGALDSKGTPEKGYFMRGERMFEANYVCMYDLLSFIPSLDDPTKSVKQDTLEFYAAYTWNNKARLVANGKILDVHSYGFNPQDELELLALTSKPERASNDKRISDVFSEHFFETNFWNMWKTLFAFEPYHSAIEMRRYLLRFMHLFPDMATQSLIHHTRYNQYDSMVRPLIKWLTDRGVQYVGNTRVTDIDIGNDTDGEFTAHGITMVQDGTEKEVEVRPEDIVIATLGSMVANVTFGTNDSPPELITSPAHEGKWALWETLSRKSKVIFRDPSVFTGHIDESKFVTYAVTQTDRRFFDLMEQFSGQEAGKNGITSLPESSWSLSFILNHQPYYQNQPEGVYVWYGIALYPEKVGDYVKKPMAECGGLEVLEELLHHLGFGADVKRILDSSTVIVNSMPFGISQFLKRKVSDRPDVIPKGSINLALTGQFVEVPDDCVFTMEYSVRSAQMAVFKLLNLAKKPNPFPRVSHDIRVVWNASKTLAK